MQTSKRDLVVNGICCSLPIKPLLFCFFCIFCSCTNETELKDTLILTEEYKDKIIAHRGVWNISGSCQNSITSITLANSYNIWGSEFDIRETKDGVWLLNHDPIINDFIIGETDYNSISSVRLSNGEILPILENVIAEYEKGNTGRLMIEVKSGDINSLLPLLHRIPEGNYCVISFYEDLCEVLLKNNVHPVYLLLEDFNSHPLEYYTSHGYDGVSVHYSQIFSYPEYIRKFHGLGMTVVAWTAESQERVIQLFTEGVDQVVADCVEQLIFEYPSDPKE